MTVHDLTRPAASSAAGSESPPRSRSPHALVMDLSTGYWKTQVTYVLAELRIADRIADAKLSADELADQTGCVVDALRRVLRAGAGLGLLASAPDGRYRLTQTGQCLRSDGPNSVRSLVLLAGAEHYLTWSRLLDCVRTGRPQLEATLGVESWWRYLQDHPDRSTLFDGAMAELSRTSQAPALRTHDFGQVHRLVDLGGGTGTLLARVLSSHPAMTGVLFDRPDVVAGASALLAAAGVEDRVEVIGGDIFDGVPQGGDAYLLCSMLHDFSDADATAILRRVRDVIDPTGRILLIEAVVPDDDSPHTAKLNDLNMIVMIDGRERTQSEFAALLASAGFELLPAAPSPIPAQLLIGIPARPDVACHAGA